jgi:Ca-activated chloride channel homolog
MKYLPAIASSILVLSTGFTIPWARAQAVPSSGSYSQAYYSGGSMQPNPAVLAGTDAQANAPLLTIKKQVDEVNVVFTATDSHGKFVKNLSQSDFRVLDDNQPPQSILAFQRATNLPLRVGLLVDASGSVRSRFGFEQNSATQFLTQVVHSGWDKAFVMGFNSHSQLMQDYTDNLAKLSTGIQGLHSHGGTAIFDAIYLACRDKLLGVDRGQPVRRAIVVLSDGEDNQSQISLAKAIQMAQRAEVVVYAISTDDSGLVMRGDGVLEQLATATGGRAFFPNKSSEVSHAFSAIEEELRSQYSLAYKPAQLYADGSYHSIEIVAQNKKVHVRARPGYYAPAQ